MSERDNDLFEELISDNQFIAWAMGEDSPMADYWNSWETNHPEHVGEFREAVRMVKILKFRGVAVSNSDIAYSWTKTSDKIKQSEPVSGFRNLISLATKVAAVLLLPLLVVSGWLLYNQYNLTQKYSNLLENKHEQNLTVVAPLCARIVVDLPDGSKVWLNSGSELTYPVVFTSSERRVHLTGEAYFKVQKGEAPFFVSSLGPEIKVYGTEFNVNSYSNEDVVTVALAEGKVSLNTGEKEEFISLGQVSAFDRKSKHITVENTDVTLYSSWREGKYVFRNASLSAILRVLQRQYNVTISLLDPKVGNYRYDAKFDNESLEQILQLLTLSAPIKYNYKRAVVKPDGSREPDHVEIIADSSKIIKN